MPELKDNRIEKFCQFVARGFNKTDAHELSGHPRNTGNASTMGTREDVIARIAEIKEKRNEEAEAKREADGVTSDDIDEEWLLDEYRMLLQETRDAGDFKVTKSVLDAIGAMRSLGDQNIKNNSVRGEAPESRQKQIAAKPAIDIEVLAKALKVFDATEPAPIPEPRDITPEEDE